MAEDLAAAIGLAELLAPHSAESAVGADLREDFSPQSLYYRLRDARAEARALERAADSDLSGETVMPTEWRLVRQLACEALAAQTKDLEIAAWLTEALVRGEGLEGLAVGAGLMSGLVGAFWSHGLYPVADEDGVATRVAPVTGLNGEGGDGTLIQPLRKLVFFRRPDGTPVAFWQFEASMALSGEADEAKRKQRIAAGVQPFADMERDARGAGAPWFATMRRQLQAAMAGWRTLDEALGASAGREAPPTSRVRDMLTGLFEACARYAPPEQADTPGATADEIQPTAELAATPGAPAATRESREDMLRQLTRIADYFRRTEPHSPLAYTLEEAVRRGRMSWPELLSEIVPDEAARNSMLIQLGIRPGTGSA